MISYILSLLSLSNAAIVTETQFAYETVTVFAPSPTDGEATENAGSTSVSTSDLANAVSVESANPTSTPESSTLFSTYLATSDISSPDATSAAETSPDAPQYSEIVFTSVYEVTDVSSPEPSSTEQAVDSAQVKQNVNSLSAEVTTSEPQTTSIAPVYTSPAPVTTSAEPETTTAAPAETTTAASVEGASYQQLDSFAQDIVDFHNKVRAEHQVGSLTWNQDLANFAQNYLDGSNCNFAHSNGPYGENIALGYDQNDQAMEAWYDEYKQYDYSAGQFSSSTGHFTQMVWKGTTEIGCGTINCPGWGPYLACEYNPRGNMLGEFTENVFP